jgi:ribosome-binding protein aMBF1 (putative translation factor)
MEHITRTTYLTPEEAAREREILAKIEQERPEMEAWIRQRRAEIRREKAAAKGDQTLGQRIRAAREARGLSQVNLAAAARISQGYLSQLEQDQREPALSIAARIAGALGVSLDSLAAESVS